MRIIEREVKSFNTFEDVAQGQVFQFDNETYMRTIEVRDVDEDFLAEVNAVNLIDGSMIWFDNDDQVEILNDARLILT